MELAAQAVDTHQDVHTLNQHALASAARFESLGRLILGRQSDWPFYYL